MTGRPQRTERAAARVAATVLAASNPAGTSTAWAVARVVDVLAGAGVGGVDLAVVDWRGAELEVPHLESYAPRIGDVVLCARPNPLELLIVDRIVGGPR